MHTAKFRRQLRDETDQWHRDGLIDVNLYQTLAERYQFETLDSPSNRHFVTLLWGLGGVLLGLGAITCVAANWQVWPRLMRMLLLLGAFAGVNGMGVWLWGRSQTSRGRRLGHSLLLTGALLLGANLGLMSQMFHQSGPVYGLFLVWSLGVLAMAYGLRLASLGSLAWILLAISYWNWRFGLHVPVLSPWMHGVMVYLPILISLLYLPLAHWTRSRVIYGLWGIGLMVGLPWDAMLSQQAPTGMMSVWLMVPSAVLWVYHTQYWPKQRHRRQQPVTHTPARVPTNPDQFQAIGRSLALWFVSGLTYYFSFGWVWRHPFTLTQDGEINGIRWMITGLFYGAIAVYGWSQQIRRDHSLKPSAPLWMKSSVFAGLLLLIGGLLSVYFQGLSLVIIGPIITNCILFFIALAMLHDGLLLGIRRRFWGGMGLLVLGLISRMFEYNTGLMLKAIVLSVCGLVVIAAGLWFESSAQPQPLTVQE